MDGTVPESLHHLLVWQPRRLVVGGVIAVALACPLAAAEPAPVRAHQPRPSQARTPSAPSRGAPSPRRTDDGTAVRGPTVDHAVMPAGGAGLGQEPCSQCRRTACPHCRLAAADHDGHARCQHGLCPAHCPVRPDVFGFYGTRWRKWPGSGVVQASNNEAATPARPPRAEVPGAAEESLEADAAAEDLPAPPASDAAPVDAAPADAAQREPAAVPPAEDAARVDAAAIDEREQGEETVPLTGGSTAWRTFTASPPRLARQP